MNLMANNFVLKGGRFFSDQLFSSDLAARWILVAPILLPLWLWAFRRVLPGWVKSRRPLILFSLLSLAASFPFFYVTFGASPATPLDLFRCMVRDGITQPSAFLLAAAGMGALIPAFRRAGAWSEKTFFRAAFAGLFIGVVMKLVVAGSALPRLEDETAYHIQGILFQSGVLKGTINPVAGIPLDRLRDLVSAPFLIQDGASFFSAHNHGWSFLLALFGMVGLKGYANVVLTFLNAFLMSRLIIVHLGKDGGDFPARVTAWIVFAGSPILFFLSNTFMAHSFALTLALILLWLHASIQWSRNGFFQASLFVVVVAAGFFVRPQSIVPLLCAMGVFNLVQLFWRADPGTERRIIVLRLALVAAGSVLSYAALRMYSGLYISGHPILMSAYAEKYLVDGCQSLGFGPGYGCFPTYGTMGHSLRKALLNIGDIAARWNQELVPGGVPFLIIACVFLIRNLRALSAGPALLYLLVVVGSVGLFGLYFHNGGESYRGRYLADCSYALPMLLALLIRAEIQKSREVVLLWWKETAPVVIGGVVLLFPVLAVVQIRGEYFHPFLTPFADASALSGTHRENAIISVREMAEAGSVGAENAVLVPDEFSGKTLEIPRSRVRRYLNLGYGTLLASSVRINSIGIPEDAAGNLLVNGATADEAVRIAAAAGKNPHPLELRFHPFEPVTKSSRIVRFWNRPTPDLLPYHSVPSVSP